MPQMVYHGADRTVRYGPHSWDLTDGATVDPPAAARHLLAAVGCVDIDATPSGDGPPSDDHDGTPKE